MRYKNYYSSLRNPLGKTSAVAEEKNQFELRTLPVELHTRANLIRNPSPKRKKKEVEEDCIDLPAGRQEGGERHMTNNGIVQIQGKEYMTVARRVELAHENRAIESIETEVISHNPVVIRAKVSIKGKVFTGISSVDLNSTKQIEKQNPYEVAETSAVGRALGFAGYGLIESIASADEMAKAGVVSRSTVIEAEETTCEVCGKPATEKKGTTRGGKPYHGIFCSTEERSHTRWLWN